MNEKKILIADDDLKMVKFLNGFLRREGFVTETANNGHDVLEKWAGFKPDIILLDIMMPQMDGLEVCRRIRENSDIPIIILSAKTQTVDKIIGFSLGIDDYLTKPFHRDELLMRIRAVLRRAPESSDRRSKTEVIQILGLIIDKTARTVLKDGREIDLTLKEFDLLWLLARHPKQVFTREQLLYHIWGTDFAEDTGIVTTLVKRTREKIEEDPANPVFIKTVRGVGYKLGA